MQVGRRLPLVPDAHLEVFGTAAVRSPVQQLPTLRPFQGHRRSSSDPLMGSVLAAADEPSEVRHHLQTSMCDIALQRVCAAGDNLRCSQGSGDCAVHHQPDGGLAQTLTGAMRQLWTQRCAALPESDCCTMH